MNKCSTVSGLALFAALAGTTQSAQADACSSLPNPVVVSGSTAVQNVVAALAKGLYGASGSDQMTIIYAGTGSCDGVQAIASKANAVSTPKYWMTDTEVGTPLTCDGPTDGSGLPIDLAFSDVFAKTCAGVDQSNLKDDTLLVIPFEFIVPKSSDQVAIDAREAYYVYGMGQNGQVTPWVNSGPNGVLYQREPGSGTQITIFTNVHLKATAALGINSNGTGGMIKLVGGSTDPQATLGFASSDAIDQARDSVKGLAYRHWKQTKYYWADSTPSGLDKQNVRDGHYPLWSYEHAVTLKDASGAGHDRAVTLIKYLNGEKNLPASAGDIVTFEAKNYVVPICAMEVSRDADGGDFTAATPSCKCAYEEALNAGSSNCKSCKSDASVCASDETCSFGFCEKK